MLSSKEKRKKKKKKPFCVRDCFHALRYDSFFDVYNFFWVNEYE